MESEFQRMIPFYLFWGGFIILAVLLLYFTERRFGILHPRIVSAKASSAIALIFILFFYLIERIDRLPFMEDQEKIAIIKAFLLLIMFSASITGIFLWTKFFYNSALKRCPDEIKSNPPHKPEPIVTCIFFLTFCCIIALSSMEFPLRTIIFTWLFWGAILSAAVFILDYTERWCGALHPIIINIKASSTIMLIFISSLLLMDRILPMIRPQDRAIADFIFLLLILIIIIGSIAGIFLWTKFFYNSALKRCPDEIKNKRPHLLLPVITLVFCIIFIVIIFHLAGASC